MFSFVNLNSQIKFKLAPQYLKELIAIQSLIAENRDEELINFLLINQWEALEGKNQYTKIKNNNGSDDNIVPILTIKFESSEIYYDRYIIVQFVKETINTVNNQKGYSVLTADESNTIISTLKKSYDIGLNYSYFKDLYDYKGNGEIITAKLSRYKIKVYNKKKPEDVAFYNCSNFMNLEAFNKPNSDGFFGPGITLYTELNYFKVPHNKFEGKYNCGIILTSAKNNANEKKIEKFDLDFFMGLDNFNDRIWLDIQERAIDDDIETVLIGDLKWATKNLDVTTYQNGDIIPEVKDQKEWNSLTTGAWCYYNNDPKNGVIYGKLYNWYAVNDPRGIAPKGFHVPSDDEWTSLTYAIDGKLGDFLCLESGGGTLKETGTSRWVKPNTNATNKYLFSALPGGERNNGEGIFGGKKVENHFYSLGYIGTWWSKRDGNAIYSYTRSLSYDNDKLIRRSVVNRNGYGYSIRCVKNYFE